GGAACSQPKAAFVSEIDPSVGGTDHGYTRWSVPPTAAKLHSASVGRRPPSHAQKANASNHVTLLMGRSSFGPGTSVHEPPPRFCFKTPAFGGSSGLQDGVQPLFGIFGCAPEPTSGGDEETPLPAAT